MVWARLLAVFQAIKVLNPHKCDKNMMHYYTDTGWDIARSLTTYYNDQESFYDGDKCIDRLFKWMVWIHEDNTTALSTWKWSLKNSSSSSLLTTDYNWRGLFTTSLGQRYNRDYLTSLFLAYSCCLIAIHTGQNIIEQSFLPPNNDVNLWLDITIAMIALFP